jgi:peptidylprolyl isomerase
MKLKLSALLLAATVAATAQTPTHKAPVTHHRTATPAKAATPAPVAAPASNIPSVPGVPQTLYTLKYIDTLVGTGPLAEARKWYTVRYTGWTADGTKFDSSYDHSGGEPITFPYGAQRVIIGWDTGFEGMHVGGKRRLFIPYQLAYGETGRPPVIPAKADLVFDIELVSMSDTPPAPPTPPASATQPDTEAPPAEETKPATEAKPQTQPATPHPESL